MATVPAPPGGSDPSSALRMRRDAVLRRWLGMELERASVGDLAERPLSERLRELEELFDAAVQELRSGGRDAATELRDQLQRAVDRHGAVGVPFTVAVFAGPGDDPERWLRALSNAAEEGTAVMEAGESLGAAILPAVRSREADAVVDRLRAMAWSAGGCRGRLPAAGRASCPDDGDSPERLLSVAHERLRRMSEATLDRSHFDREGRPAPVTPLHPELG